MDLRALKASLMVVRDASKRTHSSFSLGILSPGMKSTPMRSLISNRSSLRSVQQQRSILNLKRFSRSLRLPASASNRSTDSSRMAEHGASRTTGSFPKFLIPERD